MEGRKNILKKLFTQKINTPSNMEILEEKSKEEELITHSNTENKNMNKKNSLIPSLHISLGNIINNNTFIKCGNQSISKSKSKSRSKSKSINKSNSIVKIIDDNKNSIQILNRTKKIDNINKNKSIHKTHDGLQTERIKNSNNHKSNKVNNIPKITFDVNMNNNENNKKNNINNKIKETKNNIKLINV